MQITLMSLIILSLASFRLTRLLVFDKITEFIRAPFFDEITEESENGEIEIYYLPKKGGIKKFGGELLSCYWCTGIWSATFIVAGNALIPTIASPIILVLAIAGLASIFETIIQHLSEN